MIGAFALANQPYSSVRLGDIPMLANDWQKNFVRAAGDLLKFIDVCSIWPHPALLASAGRASVGRSALDVSCPATRAVVGTRSIEQFLFHVGGGMSRGVAAPRLPPGSIR